MNNIGGPSQFEYKEALSRRAVESGILPLCEILYEIGAIPLSSCEGHPSKIPSINFLPRKREPVKPFVLFSCSVDIARRINLVISEYVGTWYLNGYFHPKTQELVWSVEPIHIDYKEGRVDRERIDNDIHSLVNALCKL